MLSRHAYRSIHELAYLHFMLRVTAASLCVASCMHSSVTVRTKGNAAWVQKQVQCSAARRTSYAVLCKCNVAQVQCATNAMQHKCNAAQITCMTYAMLCKSNAAQVLVKQVLECGPLSSGSRRWLIPYWPCDTSRGQYGVSHHLLPELRDPYSRTCLELVQCSATHVQVQCFTGPMQGMCNTTQVQCRA